MTHDPEARSDTCRFWGRQLDCAFFDVSIFTLLHSPIAMLPWTLFISDTNVRNATSTGSECMMWNMLRFTPLVFSTSGGTSRLTNTFLKHLASHLVEKHDEPYNSTMACQRTEISFCLLQAAILCICDARSSSTHHRRDQTGSSEMVVSQAQLQNWTFLRQ